MTRHALTAALTGAAYLLGYQTARLWLGRCATECRQGRFGTPTPVLADPQAVPGPQTGAQGAECGHVWWKGSRLACAKDAGHPGAHRHGRTPEESTWHSCYDGRCEAAS